MATAAATDLKRSFYPIGYITSAPARPVTLTTVRTLPLTANRRRTPSGCWFHASLRRCETSGAQRCRTALSRRPKESSQPLLRMPPGRRLWSSSWRSSTSISNVFQSNNYYTAERLTALNHRLDRRRISTKAPPSGHSSRSSSPL